MSISRISPSSNIIVCVCVCISLFIIIVWWSISPVTLNMEELTLIIVDKLSWQENEHSLIIKGLTLLCILALATSLGLPRQVAALVAGMNLGALWGATIATLAATIGCLLTFSIARYIFSNKISTKYPQQLSKLSLFLGQQTFLKTIIIRLLPIGSNFLTNIVAGVSNVSMKSYVSGSLVGFIPQMVIFALAGSGIRLGAKNEMVASAALFAIALLLSGYLYKKHKDKTVKANTQ